MRNLLKRVILCLLCALFVFPALCVSATEDQPSPYVQWEVFLNGQQITGNGKSFQFYKHKKKGSFAIDSNELYYFAQTIEYSLNNDSHGPYENAEIHSSSRDAEWIWVWTQDGSYMYATEKGKKHLDAFLDGDFGSYVILDKDWKRAGTGAKLLQDLQALTSDEGVAQDKVKGQDIADYEYYYVGSTDRSNTFVMRQGMVIKLTDGYYYLDFAAYDYPSENNLLNSWKSYAVHRLSDDMKESFTQDLKDLHAPEKTVFYEEWEYEDEWRDDTEQSVGVEDDADSILVFKIMFVIFAILLPILPLVFGLVLPHSKKLKRPMHWYVLALVSALWIWAAIACFIVIMMI